MQTMKAIAIRQPFAFLIVRPDVLDPAERQNAIENDFFKLIENRSRASRYRGELLIHATQSVHMDDFEWAYEYAHDRGFPMPQTADHFPLGGIVGSVQMVDCVTDHPSRWFNGRYGYVFQSPIPVEFVPIRGKQSIPFNTGLYKKDLKYLLPG